MATDPRCTVLVVDDEPYILTTLHALLSREFEVVTADEPRKAKSILESRQVDIVLSDQKMPESTGVQLLEWVHQHYPKTIRLLMTGFGELEDAVDAINRGKVYRYLFKPWRADELMQVLREACRTFTLERNNEKLVDQLKALNAELEQRVLARTHELQQKNTMLERLALTDPLTSLPNRRAIDRLAESEIKRRERYSSPLALGFIDADHFKEINNRYLLPGGDAVLIELAKVLNASVRTVDTVGRIGGEEFMVVAPETTTEGAHVLAERIRSAVAKHVFTYKEQSISVSVSSGFAVVEANVPVEFEQLKHLAAIGLGEAKAAGRNRSVVHIISRAS